MVKHIVMWRFKESAGGRDKAENIRLAKEKLEGLRGKIPGLMALEVGVDISRTEASGDLALYTELADRAALEAYRVHPEHVAAAGFIAEVRLDRQVVDFESSPSEVDEA
jgi:hypothetical protein